MSTLVISYKGQDSRDTAFQLYDLLCTKLAGHTIHMGIETLITPGEDYLHAIVFGIQKAHALMVIIGPRWIEGDWLTNPFDYDRLAIKTALDNQILVIPVLVDGAGMPVLLPSELQGLSQRYPVTVLTGAVETGAQAVVDTLKAASSPARTPYAPYGPSMPYGTPPYGAASPYATPYAIPEKMKHSPYMPTVPYGQPPYIYPVADPRMFLQNTGLFLADVGSRFLAHIIDGLILAIPVIIFTFLFFPLVYVIIALYQAYFLSNHQGQTPGKKALGIRVVRVDGMPLTFGDGIVRYIGQLIGSWIFLLGYLWVLWDPYRQTWADKMVKTVVIRG
jgi:uncharacterized RDD family membrane protein YckC